MSNFQKSKSPPTGRSHLRPAHPSSFEIQLELDRGLSRMQISTA
jgi:hypothetical protein